MERRTEAESGRRAAIGAGEAPGIAAAVEEVGYREPLIALATPEPDDALRRPGPWEVETPVDGAILRGLVHP
jgi:hypothetical protein